MIAFAKTSPADCGPEPAPCLLPIGHGQRQPRKLLLPARRYQNEPGRLQVIPIDRPSHNLEWFEGRPELERDEWDTFEDIAQDLAELEWGSVRSNYPRSCERIHYLTAVQFAERVVALVAVGSPEFVQEQVEDGRRDFLADYLLAAVTLEHGRAGCILLHATWGKGFLRAFQRDAERSLERCLRK